MKSDTTSIMGTPIGQTELKELLKETKETVATSYVRQGETDRTFGAIDMWNRQKQQRTSSQMRRWLN